MENIEKKTVLAIIDEAYAFVKEQLEKEKDPNIRLVMNGEILAYEHIKKCVQNYKEV